MVPCDGHALRRLWGAPSKAFDDNGKALPFVALNTNTEFDNGSNCGRWIEVTLKENCDGGFNSQWEPCVGRAPPPLPL